MKYIGALLALALAGCGKPPQATVPTGNPNIAVDVLFEHDGCRVNRFRDSGEYIYFVTCPSGREAQATWNETRSCGKHCVRTEPRAVKTEEVPHGSPHR